MQSSGSNATARSVRMTALALGAVVALGACAKRDNAATDTTAAMTTGASTGAMATPTDTGMRAGAPAMSDANILSMIGMSNANEIASSKTAQAKATNADVKSFANDMVKDHSAMQADADKVAKQANVTPQSPPQADTLKKAAAATADSLKSAAKGSAFDTQYMSAQVAAHQQTLDDLQRFQSMATSADVKTLITNAIPKVQQHLDRAKQIQSKLGTRT